VTQTQAQERKEREKKPKDTVGRRMGAINSKRKKRREETFFRKGYRHDER